MQRLSESGCSRIGLWLDDGAEYPVWALAGHEAGGGVVEIEHVSVKNESAGLGSRGGRSFDPCAILLIAIEPEIPATLALNGVVYSLQFRGPPVSLFLR